MAWPNGVWARGADVPGIGHPRSAKIEKYFQTRLGTIRYDHSGKSHPGRVSQITRKARKPGGGRKDASRETDIYLGAMILLVTGAVVWGARLSEFDAFHLFYGGIAVFAAPVAAIAVWSIWLRLRATRHPGLAVAVLVLCVAQIEVGVALGVLRLGRLGPGSYAPIPIEMLTAIKSLPTDAKLAYSCFPLEEMTFWDARLLAIDAHTGRRVIPMCFQADFFGHLLGVPISPDVPSPLFQWAPQRTLYPDSRSQPSSKAVLSFLKSNGIAYIYADSDHPNSLVPEAIPIATSGQAQLLRVP